MATDLRLAQIAESWAHLVEVFSDPANAGQCSVEDAAVSLASEFVADCRDDEITSRLAKLIEAENTGRTKEAARHLRFVERRVRSRWSQDTAEGSPNAAKPLVAETPGRPGRHGRPLAGVSS